MLGGNAPLVDKDLIVVWFTHEWEERVFPGAPYAEGRALLRAHLEAMLDMDTGAAPKVSLNGPLIEQAQATLARMRVAQRAYALMKCQARNACMTTGSPRSTAAPTWRWCSRRPTARASTRCACRGLFTYNGF